MLRIATQKFHAKPDSAEGFRFASRKEKRRYLELRLLEKAGEITKLQVQPSFLLLAVNGIPVGKYLADFTYTEVATGKVVVEDVKGGPVRTAVYKLKKRLVEAQYSIKIQEI